MRQTNRFRIQAPGAPVRVVFVVAVSRSPSGVDRGDELGDGVCCGVNVGGQVGVERFGVDAIWLVPGVRHFERWWPVVRAAVRERPDAGLADTREVFFEEGS